MPITNNYGLVNCRNLSGLCQVFVQNKVVKYKKYKILKYLIFVSDTFVCLYILFKSRQQQKSKLFGTIDF